MYLTLAACDEGLSAPLESTPGNEYVPHFQERKAEAVTSEPVQGLTWLRELSSVVSGI